MVQVGGDLDLRHESLGAEHGAEFGIEHLECDESLVSEIAREIDHGHAACADASLNDVAAVESGVELFSGVHRASESLGASVGDPHER